jgi:hypothetical protein
VRDGQPTNFTNFGGKKMLHLAVNVVLALFFKPEKYDFILYKGLFMKNMDQIRHTLREKIHIARVHNRFQQVTKSI